MNEPQLWKKFLVISIDHCSKKEAGKMVIRHLRIVHYMTTLAADETGKLRKDKDTQVDFVTYIPDTKSFNFVVSKTSHGTGIEALLSPETLPPDQCRFVSFYFHNDKHRKLHFLYWCPEPMSELTRDFWNIYYSTQMQKQLAAEGVDKDFIMQAKTLPELFPLIKSKIHSSHKNTAKQLAGVSK
jgi:hypothetical protein